MPAQPIFEGVAIEGHSKSTLDSWYDTDPLLQRTALGAASAGLLVGLCFARSRWVDNKKRKRSSSRTATKSKGASRKAITMASDGVARAAGLMVPYPSSKEKKKRGADKKSKRRGNGNQEEEVALAREGELCSYEEEGVGLEAPSPFGADPAADEWGQAEERQAPEPSVEDVAKQAQLDEEYERIIAKHSTLRAARLAK